MFFQGTLCNDALMTTFCGWCETCRMAREIRFRNGEISWHTYTQTRLLQQTDSLHFAIMFYPGFILGASSTNANLNHLSCILCNFLKIHVFTYIFFIVSINLERKTKHIVYLKHLWLPHRTERDLYGFGKSWWLKSNPVNIWADLLVRLTMIGSCSSWPGNQVKAFRRFIPNSERIQALLVLLPVKYTL